MNVMFALSSFLWFHGIVYALASAPFAEQPIGRGRENQNPEFEGKASCIAPKRQTHHPLLSTPTANSSVHVQTSILFPSATPEFTFFPVFLIFSSTVLYSRSGAAVTTAVWSGRDTSNDLTPCITC